jgi:Polyketide cyclase / dehydrase and lipid transport
MAVPVARYRFRSTWHVTSPPADVYDVLSQPADYPLWWPQFREVRKVDDRRHWTLVRSFLPYDIAYLLTAEIADRGRGVLQGEVDGDIVGRIRWQIDPGRYGTVAYFEERVETQIDLLNLLAPFARLAFEANHRVMMRDGLVGLKAFLGARSLVGAQ